MEIMILKHYSFKVLQRVEIKVDKLSIERVKQLIESIIENDKMDSYLTFAEYYIYDRDKDGYKHTYYKELNLGKNVKKALSNIPLIVNSLSRLQQKYKDNKRVKYYFSVND